MSERVRGPFAPTLNLADVDTECAPLDCSMGGAGKMEYVMRNNFAFGGVTTSPHFSGCRHGPG